MQKLTTSREREQQNRSQIDPHDMHTIQRKMLGLSGIGQKRSFSGLWLESDKIYKHNLTTTNN